MANDLKELEERQRKNTNDKEIELKNKNNDEHYKRLFEEQKILNQQLIESREKVMEEKYLKVLKELEKKEAYLQKLLENKKDDPKPKIPDPNPKIKSRFCSIS